MILLEEESPFGSLVAVVEDDGRSVYLYLHHAEDRSWGLRALWLANRVAAPAEAPPEVAGAAPVLPKAHVRDGGAHPGFAPGALSLVWLEAGDGVVVLEREGEGIVGALLPAGEPRGLAAGAVGVHPLASELTERDRRDLVARLTKARAHWRQVRGPGVLEDVAQRTLRSFADHLGPSLGTFAGEGTRFPPLRIGRYALSPKAAGGERRSGPAVWITAGIGAFPVPFVPDLRVEIALAEEGGEAWAPGVLAWLARYPWAQMTSVGDGHVIPAPVGQATWFPEDRSAVLLVTDPPPDASEAAPNLSGLVVDGHAVAVLWAIPLTMDERRLAQRSGRDAVLRALSARGAGFVAR